MTSSKPGARTTGSTTDDRHSDAPSTGFPFEDKETGKLKGVFVAEGQRFVIVVHNSCL